jgi:hypothetical protein
MGDDTDVDDTDVDKKRKISGYYSFPPDYQDGDGFSVTASLKTRDQKNNEISAKWQSSFGIYFINETSPTKEDTISGFLLFNNVNVARVYRENVKFNFEVKKPAADGVADNSDVYEIPKGAAKFGFFLIPDGYSLNLDRNVLVGFNPRAIKVDFKKHTNTWEAFLGGDKLNGKLYNDVNLAVLFTSPELNPENRIHLNEQLTEEQKQLTKDDNETHATTLTWEDGFDNDYLDSHISIEIKGKNGKNINFEPINPICKYFKTKTYPADTEYDSNQENESVLDCV